MSTAAGTPVIALENLKGGVAKTTSALAIAAEIASRGGNVLLIDLDLQKNLTTVVDPEEDVDSPLTVLDVIANSALSPEAAISSTAWSQTPAIREAGGAVDLIRGDSQFKDQQIAVYGIDALKDALSNLESPYTAVLLDCPPNSGLAVQTAFAAADWNLIVTEPQHLALLGVAASLDAIEEFNSACRTLRLEPVQVAGILMTRYAAHQSEHVAAVKEARETFGDLLMEPIIPFRAVVQQSISAHYPLREFTNIPAREVKEAYSEVVDILLRICERELPGSHLIGAGNV